MSDANAIPARDSIDTYLAVTALIVEGRPRDAFALITAQDAEEQLDMWLAGCSITAGFAARVAAHLGIPADDLPEWLRALALADGDDK